jgi:hypothetical protein
VSYELWANAASGVTHVCEGGAARALCGVPKERQYEHARGVECLRHVRDIYGEVYDVGCGRCERIHGERALAEEYGLAAESTEAES